MSTRHRDIIDWIQLIRSILLAAGVVSILILAATNQDQQSRAPTGAEASE
jgi:hypothetical protein